MTRQLKLAAVTCLALFAAPCSGTQAQLYIKQEIVVLPLVNKGIDEDLSLDLYKGIIAGLRLMPGQELAGPSRVQQLASGLTPSGILGDREKISTFAERSGASFVIGGVVRRLEQGRIEVTTIIYSKADRQIREMLHSVFDTEAEALAGAEEIGRKLSHPRNYSPKDTPLLYSLIFPGLGQLQMDAPLHALTSAGLVAGAVLYGMSAPKPDRYQIDFTDYHADLIPGTSEYRYFIRHREVPAQEYFHTLDADIEHNLCAIEERRAAEVRKNWATRFIIASCLFNVLDTLWLIRQEVDARPFYVRLEAIPEAGGPARRSSIRLQLRWTLLFP